MCFAQNDGPECEESLRALSLKHFELNSLDMQIDCNSLTAW